MEKTILIVCGTGVASSAIMNNAVQDLLERNKLDSKVILCRYSQMESYISQADLIIASLDLPERPKPPVIMGTGFLTGVGVDELEEKPDLIIVDPPRDGIHPKAIGKIIDFGAPEIVYVSCKPTSLARDLEIFQQEGYRVEKVKLMDMFPRTVHVETVALLKKV